MNCDEAVEHFSALDQAGQLRVLARFASLMTLVARDAYRPSKVTVPAAQWLEQVNELQHRVLDHIGALLNHRKDRYPDDVLIRMFLGDYPLIADASKASLIEALGKRHDS